MEEVGLESLASEIERLVCARGKISMKRLVHTGWLKVKLPPGVSVQGLDFRMTEFLLLVWNLKKCMISNYINERYYYIGF